MRTPEEKEILIKEWQASGMGVMAFAKSKGIQKGVFRKWIRQYDFGGLASLESQSGKHGSGNRLAALRSAKNLSEVERLKLELLKKEIEIERLKKGYMVRGAGRNKEFYVLKKKNSK
jgi:transposase-like protein